MTIINHYSIIHFVIYYLVGRYTGIRWLLFLLFSFGWEMLELVLQYDFAIETIPNKIADILFNFFGLIPWDPPSFMIIGIWPILMGASMWVQQKLNPAPADPIQAKIFAFFPLFLTIILASFPSGLVVYWTINNTLTIAQQYVIVKKTTVKTN